MRRFAAILSFVAAGALAVHSQQRLDQAIGQYRTQGDVLYLWSGEHVKRLFPGFESLAADIYWLRTVQYFGGQRVYAEGKNFELLTPLVDIATTLDPRLEVAYRYGATFLCEGKPYGAGRPEEGIRLLEKGARALPLAWRLREDLGFFHFFYLHDPEKAAQTLVEASEIPGAAPWLRTMAASLLLKGGHRQESRQMWEEMLRYSDEGVLKTNARINLEILDALDQAAALTEAVGRFEHQFRRRPENLVELRASLDWRGPVSDSRGLPFEYHVDSGRVRVSRQSPLWRPASMEE